MNCQMQMFLSLYTSQPTRPSRGLFAVLCTSIFASIIFYFNGCLFRTDLLYDLFYRNGRKQCRIWSVAACLTYTFYGGDAGLWVNIVRYSSPTPPLSPQCTPKRFRIKFLPITKNMRSSALLLPDCRYSISQTSVNSPYLVSSIIRPE